MRLFEEFMQPCQIVDRISTPDGLGGFTSQWVDGAKFKAAIIKDQTLAARVAEKEGVTEVYTITAPPTIPLDFHDVVRRLEDGATFRVTTNAADSETPERATFGFTQVRAEKWEIPK